MLEKLKLLLGISTDEAKTAFAEHALETAANAVLSYCNRDDPPDEIPAGLQTIIINVAINIYRVSSFGSE